MKDVSVIVSFPSRIADRLRPFVSTEETHYYLNGIHIIPKEHGTRFEATNGYILGVEYAEDVYASEELILSLPKPSLIASAIGKRGGLYTVYKTPAGVVLGVKRLAANSDGAPQIFENDLIFTNSKIDGVFPDCDRIIPRDATEPSRGVFSHKYLAVVASAIGSAYVKPLSKDERSPAVAYSADQKFVAVIMPMRDDTVVRPLPAWLSSPEKQAA